MQWASGLLRWMRLHCPRKVDYTVIISTLEMNDREVGMYSLAEKWYNCCWSSIYEAARRGACSAMVNDGGDALEQPF